MNSGMNAFGKEYLKDDHEIEVIFHNSQIVGKTLNTGRVTVNRFIKKIDDDKYAIIYKKGDIPEISSKTELPDMSKKTCNDLLKDKPDLWILHTSDKKYHRVNFNETLIVNSSVNRTVYRTVCDKISNPSDPDKSIVINPDVVKTEAELEQINYVPVDDTTKDVFKLGFNLGDMTKWFAVDGFDRITSENLLTVCSSDQYESKPPNSKLINQNGSDITINTSDRIYTPLTQCTDWNIVTPPIQKEILNSTGQNVTINSSDRECQSIYLTGKSLNSHFITNYDSVYIEGENKFSGELDFKPLSNCQNNSETKEYVANWEDFNDSKKQIRDKNFHTINRECRPLNLAECDNKYVVNADHFMFDVSRLNNNNVYSNLVCQTLNNCRNNQYFNYDEFSKTKINVNGKNIYTKNISEFCINQPVCGNNQYIANIEDLNTTKTSNMFTKPFVCQNITTCGEDEYETAQPEKNGDPLTNGFFVKDRVCSPLNSCEEHINIEVKLSAPIISSYGNTETRKIKDFDNAYFVNKNENLNFFTCEGIRVEYKLEFNPRYGYNNDVPQFRTRPKFILKKSKEVVAMIQLNVTDNDKTINLELSDTDETKTNTFKKFPNDIFELYLDTGSCKRMTMKIEDFVFKCKRRQYVHQEATSETDNNECKYEHPDIKDCENNQYYDLTLSPENEQKGYLYKESTAYCKEYNTNDCKISDKSISCANTDDSYKNDTDGINASYKQLYNDTLFYDTTNECASKCTSRKGCGAFKMNPLTNICDYYGFETVKIEIGGIDLKEFDIKYNTDDTSVGEVFIDLKEFDIKYNTDDTSVGEVFIEKATKTFNKPFHITYLTIEPKNSASINDLPDGAYIKFYYYDNSYKLY